MLAMLPAKTPWRASVKLTTCSKSGTLDVPNNVESMVRSALALATPGYPNFLFAVRLGPCNCRATVARDVFSRRVAALAQLAAQRAQADAEGVGGFRAMTVVLG